MYQKYKFSKTEEGLETALSTIRAIAFGQLIYIS